MKRWLGLITSIGLLGMLSEGDASFGGAAVMRDGYDRMHAYVQREYGDQLDQFWQTYGVDVKNLCKNQSAHLHNMPQRKKGGFSRYCKHRFVKQPQQIPAEFAPVPVSSMSNDQPAVKANQSESIVKESSADQVIDSIVQLLTDKLSQIETRISQKNDDKMNALEKRIEGALASREGIKEQSIPVEVPSAAIPAIQQQALSQPMTYQQPMIPQNNMQQTAACAMQLQASAMAMQAQASAMMMQAQQQAMPIVQHNPVTYETLNGAKGEKQEKINRLLQKTALLNPEGIHTLLKLLDVEFDTLEGLLAGASASFIAASIKRKNDMLQRCSPLIISAFDLVIELATTSEKCGEDPRLYHYFVRKGKRPKNNCAVYGRKRFLRNVMLQLETYYQMIEKLVPVVS